jgi:uncharacterized protein (DUF885 family)
MLETYTLDRFNEDLVACQSFLRRANDLLNKSNNTSSLLTDFERLNLSLFKAEVSTFINGFPFKGFYFPINFLEGVQVDFSRLADWMTLKEVKDLDNLIERYAKFNGYADQIVSMMDKAITEGLTNHSISMVNT